MDAESVSSITRRSDSEPLPSGGRESVLERPDVVVVEPHRLVVAGVASLDLAAEPGRLILGVVQLREAVGDLLAGDEQLESIGEERVIGRSRATAATLPRGAR